MSVSSDIDPAENLLGLTVGDLEEDVNASDGVISGTLKYVSGYTGFSGDPDEQAGNYLALVIEAADGDTITAELTNGNHGPVTLDADGILIARISDKDAQELIFTATGADGTTEQKRFSLSGLTLEEAESED